MRGLREPSTDFLYSPFPREELIELGQALGVGHINVVTTATLAPERVLFHSCLNGVQSMLQIPEQGEIARGEAIAGLSNRIFDRVKADFYTQLSSTQVALQKQGQQLDEFVQTMEDWHTTHGWDAEAFDSRWPPVEEPASWRDYAIETYRTVMQRIEQNDYTPAAGWDAAHATQFWGMRNIEYEHYRTIARQLVEDDLQRHNADQLLTQYDADQRQTIYVVGPIGAGKSQMTRQLLDARPTEIRHDIIVHNADFLKIALADAAIRDGMLSKRDGRAVHNESSNALYEGTRKRRYFAETYGKSPDVLINSIKVNDLELDTGLTGGAPVEAHVISMSLEDAYRSAAERQESGHRMPSRADIAWSVASSVTSLSTITAKGQSPIHTTLYNRAYGQSPAPVATLDSQNQQCTILDAGGFAEVLARAGWAEGPEASTRFFLSELQSKEWSITLADSRTQGSTGVEQTSNDYRTLLESIFKESPQQGRNVG
jgi:hypothetical protein